MQEMSFIIDFCNIYVGFYWAFVAAVEMEESEVGSWELETTARVASFALQWKS